MSIRVYECMYSHVHVLHILTGICTIYTYIYIYIYMSIFSHTHIGLRIEADGKHSLGVR